MSLLVLLQQGGIAADSTATSGVPDFEVSIMDLLLEGGWYIMIPLAFLSILTVFIFIERMLAVNKALGQERDFMSKIKDYIHDGKIDSAKNLCSTSESPVARMLEKGIARIGKPMRDIAVSIENVGKLEIYNLERNLSGLATIAGAAPMIGFLGTVIGMVQVFMNMEAVGTVRVSDISSGTKQAMITTIVGLIVGVLAFMAYNYLVARVSKVIHKMEAGSIEFLDILEEPGK
jgi:biopolymer transport protein ExbB